MSLDVQVLSHGLPPESELAVGPVKTFWRFDGQSFPSVGWSCTRQGFFDRYGDRLGEHGCILPLLLLSSQVVVWRGRAYPSHVVGRAPWWSAATSVGSSIVVIVVVSAIAGY